MGDLISRSALLKYLRDYKWEFAMGSDFSKAMEMIDAQPTAYDVEKVVAELKNESDYEPIDYDYYDMPCTDEQYFIATGTAIDIVKAGGVE